MHYVWLGVAGLAFVLLLGMTSGGDRRDDWSSGAGPSGDADLDEFLQADEARRHFGRDRDEEP